MTNITTLTLVLSGLAVITGVGALVVAVSASRWRKHFTSSGELPENLEEIIASIAAKIKSLENGQAASNTHVAKLEELLGHSIQHVGLVRFNSMADEGGNLSFSLALLDAHHSGVVITSLHGRQQNRIYAKQITESASEVQLSEEEQEAIFDALKRKQQKQKPK